MSKKITVIPAKIEPKEETVLRVAAYCRVSTDHEEQNTSLKSQVAYYTQKICENPGWDFAGVYAEQESGTAIENRDELNQLNVTVCFEMEGINTKEKKFRHYISMAAVAAQEKSHYKGVLNQSALPSSMQLPLVK